MSPVSSAAEGDRLVIQVPLLHAGGLWSAYPEHVSGAKHKGHMGMMVIIMAALGGYAVWNYFFGEQQDGFGPDGRL